MSAAKKSTEEAVVGMPWAFPTTPLGVGLVYAPALEPLIRGEPGLVQVLEIEPQTFWRKNGRGGYVVDTIRLKRLAELPGARIAHGVGFPVGSARLPDPAHIRPLVESIELTGARWTSEHLNFNRGEDADGRYDAGFLLPPCQTIEGACAAAASARQSAAALPVPFLIENGVSYLAPRARELSDGMFLRQVAERADCGILLDLHNAWANDRNGRQPISDFLRDIPFERVRELHLAGGMVEHGYWLDAHSGPAPPELMELAREIVPRLRNLGAIIFEIMPTYIDIVGLDVVRRELEQLHDLWQLRSPEPLPLRASAKPRRDLAKATNDALHWETTLAELVTGRSAKGSLAEELQRDPGVAVYRRLIAAYRASAVIGTLPFTGRLLIASLKPEALDDLFDAFWKEAAPEAFGEREARNFASFLSEREIPTSISLQEILRFDLAVIDALTENRSARVSFSFDPVLVLGGLVDHQLPEISGRSPETFYVDVSPAGINFGIS
jgi:uncharacterized protein (UPF0276 family)